MELEQRKLKFHGIPWNFVKIQSSMEFHGTFSILLRSMEFHGTFNFPPKVPWNSMELENIIFLNIVFGIWLMIRCYLAGISQKRYILHWFQYRNSYFEHPVSAKMAQGQRKCRAVYVSFKSYPTILEMDSIVGYMRQHEDFFYWNTTTGYNSSTDVFVKVKCENQV